MNTDIAHYESLRNTKFKHCGMVSDFAVRKFARMSRIGLKLARKRAGLTQQEIADRIGVSVPQVSRWENGVDGIPSQRLPSLVQAYEAPIEVLLADDKAAATAGIQSVENVHQIRNLGKVAQGVWLEESHSDPDNPEYVPYDRVRGDPGPEDLFAVTPEGLSMNLEFKPGTRLICRRIPFGDTGLKSGDFVIVERAAHDLHELTCKQIEFGEDGVARLYSRSDQPQFQEPICLGKPDEGLHIDNEIVVIGKVIRAVKNYEGD